MSNEPEQPDPQEGAPSGDGEGRRFLEVHPAYALGLADTRSERGRRERLWGWLDARGEIKRAWRSESDHLARLVILRLLFPDDSPREWNKVAAADELSRITPWQLEFIYHRFSSRIRWYARAAPSLSFWYTLIALLVVASGLLTSGLTAIQQAASERAQDDSILPYVVIGLGVAIGVLTGLSQVWKPAQKSVSYYAGQHDLRQEGWDFVNKRGRYRTKDYPEAAFAVFVDAVTAIERRALAVDLQGAGAPESIQS
jgi:hypothetical protein